MNTPTATSAPIVQSGYVFSDAEFTPLNKAATADVGGEQKDQTVVTYLNQTQVAAAAPATPQIAKPLASTGIEIKQEIIAELKKMKTVSPDAAKAELQAKLDRLMEDYLADPSPENERILLNGLAIIFLAPTGSTPSFPSPLPAAVLAEKELILGLISELDAAETEESWEEIYKRMRKELEKLTTDFINNPTEESAYKLGIALICMLADIQKVKLQVQAELAGLMNELGYKSAQNQAKATIEQGKAALWGGISMAITTVAMAGAGYMVQKYGFMQRDEAFRLSTENRNFELGLAEKNYKKGKDQLLESYNIGKRHDGTYDKRGVYGRHDQEYEQKMRDLDEQLKRQEKIIEQLEAQRMPEPPRKSTKTERLDRELEDLERQSDYDFAKREALEAREMARDGWAPQYTEQRYQEALKAREGILRKIDQEKRGQAEALRFRDLAQTDHYSAPNAYQTSVFQQDNSKKGWLDRLMSREDRDPLSMTGRGARDGSMANVMNPDDKIARVSWLREEIHRLNMIADDFQAKGHAAVSSLGVAQVAQTFTNAVVKEEEAQATMDSAEANIYRELLSLAMQVYAAADNFMNTLINNLLESLGRAIIETNKQVGGGMGRG